MSVEVRPVIAVEKLMEKAGSIYKLVIVAAKRALEISEGSPKLVPTIAKEKPALTALREMAAGKVGVKVKKQKA